MSSFRAYYARNIKSDHVVERTPDPTDTFVTGDFVYWDTTTDTLKICGADPSLIAALAEAPSTSTNLTPTGKVGLRLLQADSVLAMASATDFAESYVGDSLDIIKTSSGLWRVAITTSAPRVLVIGGVPAAENVDGAIWFVQVLAANVQFDAVAS